MTAMASLPYSFQIFVITVLGLLLGSFATALVYRIPKKEPILGINVRSKCACRERILSTIDLIPLFSWLFQKGQCRKCNSKISAKYPVIEILTAALCVWFFFAFEENMFRVVLALASAPILISLLFIDLEHKILPNTLISALLFLGALNVATYPYEDLMALATYPLGFVVFGGLALLIALFFQIVAKKNALGMGDVKFFAVAGLWLGLQNLAAFCILAGVLGVVFGVLWQQIKKEKLFPFGPALIVAFIVVLTFDISFLIENIVK